MFHGVSKRDWVAPARWIRCATAHIRTKIAVDEVGRSAEAEAEVAAGSRSGAPTWSAILAFLVHGIARA